MKYNRLLTGVIVFYVIFLLTGLLSGVHESELDIIIWPNGQG